MTARARRIYRIAGVAGAVVLGSVAGIATRSWWVSQGVYWTAIATVIVVTNRLTVPE